MSQKKYSRPVLIAAAILLVGGGLTYAFWPRPMIVEIGEAMRGEMRLTIDEQGRTQVGEVYTVSTPISGRLLRVEVQPGDPVVEGETVVARMRPANPVALDVRTKEQALAAVEAAEAGMRVAEANLEAARADADLSRSDLARTERLADSGTVSPAALDHAQSATRAAEARLATAAAAIEQRKAELQAAQAQLIGFDDRGLLEAVEAQLGEEVPIRAPTDGVILQVINQDETTLAAGAPILVIGDTAKDLEVVVELISPDAIRIEVGDPVIIGNWGGEVDLEGEVTRVEPYGQTKVSALGVEEQRVKVVATLTSPAEARDGLGHGFSVQARIVIWSSEDALTVPSSALFREGGGWALFVVEDGVARMREVEVGADNGIQAEIVSGISAGDAVVVYPPTELSDGMAVERRVTEG